MHGTLRIPGVKGAFRSKHVTSPSTRPCHIKRSSTNNANLSSPELQLPVTVSSELGPNPRARLNPATLAFLGDAVWEAFARQHFFKSSRTVSVYHEKVKLYVQAEQQAVYHDTLANGELLTDVERDVLRWAGNSAVSRRSLDTLVYKKATAFEILLAYLYCTDVPRCNMMMAFLIVGSLAKPAPRV